MKGHRRTRKPEMHLEVSPLALPQKLQDFLAFAHEVARRERLTSWKLVLWGPPCEAECDDAGKTIYMGTCGTLNLMKQLFLHEVAHALIKPKNQKDRDDSFWHREKWRRNFERLMKKHLPDVKRPDPYVAETAKTRPRQKCRPARRGSAGVWGWRQK